MSQFSNSCSNYILILTQSVSRMRIAKILAVSLLIQGCGWFLGFGVAGEDSEVVNEAFQFKNIVLAVLIDASSLPLLEDSESFRSNFEHLVNSTIIKLNNGSFDHTHSNGYSSLGGVAPVTNASRISTISVYRMEEFYDSFDGVSEVSVLFTLSGCEDAHGLNKRVTKMFGPIVHLAVTEAGCGRLDSSSAITVPLTYLRPNADLLQLIVDMRGSGVLPGWKETIIINDADAGDGIIDAFGLAFSALNLNTPAITQTIYNVDSLSRKSSLPEQVEDVLKRYQKSSPGNHIVITSSANINRVLEAVKRIGMLTILKQWVFISPDPIQSNFNWDYIAGKIINDGVNVGFVMNSSVNSSASPRHGTKHLACDTEALLSLLSDVVETLAAAEFDLYLQVSNEEWDIIKPSRLDRVINITAALVSGLSSRVLGPCDKNSSSWNLLAAENGVSGKQVFEVGWWNPLTGIRMTDDLLPHVTGGFRGRNINVASMHFPPWQLITRDDPSNPDNVTYSGLMFEVLNHMSKDLNFSYTVMEPRPGETWGTQLSDGSWTGMMKMVAENKVVIAAAAFTVTPDRSKYVNFTQVLEREAYGFMVNRPAELSRVLLFAAPFSYPVWICIVITVICVSPVLYLVHRTTPYYEIHGMEGEKDQGLYKMKHCYWYIYGSLLQQGGIHLPEAISGRMLIGFWWLFVIVTVTTYSGNLVAFLTFPKIESPVNTVEDLTNFRGVDSWGFLEGSVIEDHLKRSPDKQFEILYRKAVKHPVFNESVLNRVSHHQHAYIDWKIVLLTAIRDSLRAKGRCEYIIGAETFFEEKIALAVPKNSPYLPIFNKQIGTMLQTGLIKKWKSRYWPGKDRCSMMTIGAGNRKVGIGDMQGSFYLLFMGFLISAVVLLVEVIVFRRKKARMIEALKIFVANTNKTATNFWQQKQFPFLH